MDNFFKPRERSSVKNLTDEPESKTKKIAPQEGIKHRKRKRFNSKTILERIKLMRKHVPKDNWRCFDRQKITYTELIQYWAHTTTGETKIWYFCSWEY